MAKVQAENWQGKSWNSSSGRVVWWLRRGDAGSQVARAAARTFYREFCADVGQDAAQQQLAERGIAELPTWLVGGE